MTHNRQTTFLATAVILILASCSSNDMPAPISGQGGTVLALSGESRYASLPLDNGESWVIESTPDWITAVEESGNAGEQITIYVESNSRDTRHGEILVTYENGEQLNLPVTQSRATEPYRGFRTYAVGWGFDVRTNYDFRGLRDQIFNTEKLNREYPNCYKVRPTKSSFISYFYGESGEELSQQLSAELNLNVKYNAFELDLQGKFGKTAINDSKRIFAWIRNSYCESQALLSQLDMADVQEEDVFTADFAAERQKVIDADGTEESIQMLIDHYGTHIVEVANLGGFWDYYYSSSVEHIADDLDVEAAIKFGFAKKFNLGADAKYKQSFEQLSNQTIEKFEVKGGDAIELSIAVQSGTINQSATDKWLTSLNSNERNELLGFQIQPISVLFPADIESKIEEYVVKLYYYHDLSLTRSNKH